MSYPSEFYREAPPDWVRLLAEHAPQMPGLDTLVFRYFAPVDPDGTDRGWQCPEQGQWTLYSAKDIRLVEKERAAQFEKHWSELSWLEQEGRKGVVSDYQFFMWHTKGLYVMPFLVLQGEWGGTPAKYTDAEIAFLQGSGCFDEPYPIGMFPACPFDGRVIKQIANRDRLLKHANDLAAMEKDDTPEGKRALSDAAAVLKRETTLDTWRAMIQPSVEFMKLRGSHKSVASALPAAPAGLAETVARWKDHWLEHGVVLGAGPAAQKQVQIAVK